MSATAKGSVEAAMETAARWRDVPSPGVATALQNLVQAYALFTDEGRAEELASLFTADATWSGDELGYGTASGPEAIAEVVLRHFDPARPMMHVPSSALLVAVSDDEVHGVCSCLASRSSDDRAAPLIWFYYHDVFRRDDGGWRFAARTLRLRFRTGGG